MGDGAQFSKYLARYKEDSSTFGTEGENSGIKPAIRMALKGEKYEFTRQLFLAGCPFTIEDVRTFLESGHPLSLEDIIDQKENNKFSKLMYYISQSLMNYTSSRIVVGVIRDHKKFIDVHGVQDNAVLDY